MTALLLGGFLLLLAVLSAFGWVADSRDHEPQRSLAAPHDTPHSYD